MMMLLKRSRLSRSDASSSVAFVHIVPGERVELGLGEFGEIEYIRGAEDRIAQLAMLVIGQQERRTREELKKAQRGLSSIQHYGDVITGGKSSQHRAATRRQLKDAGQRIMEKCNLKRAVRPSCYARSSNRDVR